MNLALFDLDHTLLNGDSDQAWTHFLMDKGIIDRAQTEAKSAAYYRQYQNGTLNVEEFLAFQLAPLARNDRDELEHLHVEFMQQCIRPMIEAPARALLQKHRDNDDLIALVTATNCFVVGPIARELGIEHVVSTVAAQENGRFTGGYRGTPNFREGKITGVEQWLETLGLYWSSFAESWFYSDSLNDLPLLKHVTHPVAVDPDDTLAVHAKQQQWPVISLRT